MQSRTQSSSNRRLPCTWLMPLDVPSIEQASFCIGSTLVRVDKQLQAISPFGLPGGVHGLSTQIGALRPVLTATALAVCSRC